jgi:D-xylose transport system substrate-binding protein
MIKQFSFLGLLIGCFVFSLTSCHTKSKPKIGFLLPNLVSDRYQKEKECFTKKIEELGGEAIVKSADYNDQLQIQQAQELIEQDVAVLVVNSINLNTAAAIVRAAHDHDIKVIAYDRLISNCDLDYLLTFDNEKVGTLMADYVTKLKPEGSYILLGGDKADKNAIWVKKGQMQGVASSVASGKIKIVYDTYIEDWSGDNARICMKKYLDLSESTPDVVLSSFDGMSTSIIELLKEYDLAGKVLITGQDAELAACRNIVKGFQVMTVYKSVRNLANKAAELSMKLARNENISEETKKINNGAIDVPAILLEPVVVDKNNLKTTVIADGFHKEEDIYAE